MAAKIEGSAKREGRNKGREERVAWATVHKELSKKEAHRGRAGEKEASSSSRKK